MSFLSFFKILMIRLLYNRCWHEFWYWIDLLVTHVFLLSISKDHQIVRIDSLLHLQTDENHCV